MTPDYSFWYKDNQRELIGEQKGGAGERAAKEERMDRMAKIKRQVKKDWEMQGYQRCLELLEQEYSLRMQLAHIPDQMQGLKLAINILKLSSIVSDLRRASCEK